MKLGFLLISILGGSGRCQVLLLKHLVSIKQSINVHFTIPANNSFVFWNFHWERKSFAHVLMGLAGPGQDPGCPDFWPRDCNSLSSLRSPRCSFLSIWTGLKLPTSLWGSIRTEACEVSSTCTPSIDTVTAIITNHRRMERIHRNVWLGLFCFWEPEVNACSLEEALWLRKRKKENHIYQSDLFPQLLCRAQN